MIAGLAPRSAGLADRRRRRLPVIVWPAAAGVLIEFALLALWQRNGYWDFSDGVYAASARELLHGLAPYQDFAAAQPPPVYLFGAGLLALHDGLASLRIGLGLVDLATAALVGVCVWRLTGRRGLAVAAAAAAPLVPISLHEHAQLTPETLAAPLLLGGALACARVRGSSLGGFLLALGAVCKVAFLLPALAVALASPGRRRTVTVLGACVAAMAALSLLVYGTAVWRQAVEAQLQVGRTSLYFARQLVAQGAWNEFPLAVLAVIAVVLAWKERHRARDRDLVRTVGAAAGGGLLLGLSLFKRGSYINVLAVAEPPVLVLAVCGALWSWQRGRRWRPLMLGLGAVLAAQVLSLLISPGDPSVAKRPFAQTGLRWSAGPSAVDRAVAEARRCPLGLAYSGPPYIAFLASRRLPGDQPDVFIIENAPIVADFARRANADRPLCPPR